MDVDDWEKYYRALMEEEVEQQQRESSLQFEENPFKPRQLQLQQSKEELMRQFRLEDASEVIDRALDLIVRGMKERLSEEEWEELLDEFISVDESLMDFFERERSGEIDHKEYVSLHEMCGISLKTLGHCYHLGKCLYDRGELEDARALFGFLTTVAPYILEFWIALALSGNKQGAFSGAIDTLLTAEKLFPDEAAVAMHLASNYIASGDDFLARQKLNRAKELFALDEKAREEWKSSYDYLYSRAFRSYKKLV